MNLDGLSEHHVVEAEKEIAAIAARVAELKQEISSTWNIKPKTQPTRLPLQDDQLGGS